MPLTRIAVEAAMVGRLNAALLALGRSVVVDGANPDLNEPMAGGLDALGVYPIDRAAVADADLAAIDDTLAPYYLDLVEIRALEACAAAIGFKARSQQWEDYKVDRTGQLQWLLQLITDRRAAFAVRHGGSTGPIAVVMGAGIRHKLDLTRDCDR